MVVIAEVIGLVQQAWSHVTVSVELCLPNISICSGEVWSTETPESENTLSYNMSSVACIRAPEFWKHHAVGIGRGSRAIHHGGRIEPRDIWQLEAESAFFSRSHALGILPERGGPKLHDKKKEAHHLEVVGRVGTGTAALNLAANFSAAADSSSFSFYADRATSEAHIRSKKLEHFCYLVILQLMGLQIIHICVMQILYQTSQVSGPYTPPKSKLIKEKLDPYSRSLLDSAIELKELSRNLHVPNFETSGVEGNPDKNVTNEPCSSEYLLKHEKNKSIDDFEEQQVWSEGEQSAPSPVTDYTLFGETKMGHANEAESQIQLLRNVSENTEYPGVESTKSGVSKEQNGSRKKQKASAEYGLLISSLLKYESPKQKIKKAAFHPTQNWLPRSTTPHSPKPTFQVKKTHTKRRKKKVRRHLQRKVSKGSKRIETTHHRKHSKQPKNSACSEDELILVVNYRKNGSRLITYSDQTGFRKYVSFLIDADVEDTGFTFRGYPPQLLGSKPVSSSSHSLVTQELETMSEIRDAINTSKALDNSSQPEEMFSGEELENWKFDTPENAGESSLVISKQTSIREHASRVSEGPKIPQLDENENFAPKECLQDSSTKSEFKASSVFGTRRQEFGTRFTSNIDVSEEVQDLCPTTPNRASPLKSILSDPKKRSPESKSHRQRVSFDFCQPDPFGEEANSYPVVPLYSSEESKMENAESRLMFLFQTDEEDEVTGASSQIILGSRIQASQPVGVNQGIFELPGSGFF